MTQKILTDCDGCLLNWEDSFHEWMTQRGYNRVEQGTYDLAVAYDIHKDHKHDVVREFNASAWMCCLEPFRDARSGVARLVEAGYHFDVITSLSLDPFAKKLRQQNLDTHFGKTPWNDLVCLDTGADKDAALEPFRDTGLWWIEDLPKNCEVGLKLGLKPILITHDHNKDYHNPNVIRADSWGDICDIILE